jgi:predicted dehydrogenase
VLFAAIYPKSVLLESNVTKIRIGVAGPGIIWTRAHKPALDAAGDLVEITAFSASSERRRAEVAEAYPGVPFYLDYHDLIASPEVDWVLVLTPIALNATVALAAMQAGKHVFVEKPMACSLDEARQLLDLADRTGRHLFVLEQFVYASSITAIEEVLLAGEIGDVIMYEQVSHEIYDAETFDATAWRTAADYPLGRLFDGGHHPLARLNRLFGPPTTVCASAIKIRPGFGEFDHVLMLMEHPGGVMGTFSHGSVMNSLKNHFYIRGTEGTLSVGWEELVVERNDGSTRTVPVVRERHYHPMWRALLAAITEGGEPYYTKERAFADLSTLMAIQRSAREGVKVSL